MLGFPFNRAESPPTTFALSFQSRYLAGWVGCFYVFYSVFACLFVCCCCYWVFCFFVLFFVVVFFVLVFVLFLFFLFRILSYSTTLYTQSEKLLFRSAGYVPANRHSYFSHLTCLPSCGCCSSPSDSVSVSDHGGVCGGPHSATVCHQWQPHAHHHLVLRPPSHQSQRPQVHIDG